MIQLDMIISFLEKHLTTGALSTIVGMIIGYLPHFLIINIPIEVMHIFQMFVWLITSIVGTLTIIAWFHKHWNWFGKIFHKK